MNLDVNDFAYLLPEERIAKYPLPQRDHSKLLIYQQGSIRHEIFSNIVNFLPAGASLFFNETKVIPARLFFQKGTGAVIEIFLLHPVSPSSLLLEAMQATDRTTWKCTIGNLKRWTNSTALSTNVGNIRLTAELQDRDQGFVKFSWNSRETFAEILQRTGNTPLPPYLKRESEASDKERYQTVYSSKEGAVAAPTAGLHFTNAVLDSLRKKNISTDFLTLHVSAGTFQPIKAKNPWDHTMHEEQIVVSRENVVNILKSELIIPVGTTSMRTLESLYWFGVKLIENPQAKFVIAQQEPYVTRQLPESKVAIAAVLEHLDNNKLSTITGETSIYIVPGYTFRICKALITNFHQPCSTLILLVAAFIGDDWRKVYDSALQNDYRFLSYGDSSLLIPRSAAN